MKPYKWILTTTLVIASTTLPLHSFATSETSPKDTPKVNTQEESRVVLARVNGQPIYDYQLKPQVEHKLKKYKQFNSKGQQPTESLINNLRQGLLQEYIDTTLLVLASQKHSVDNLDEKITLFKEKAIKNNQTVPSDKSIKSQILFREYLKAHDLADPMPSEEAVKARYEKGKQNFLSQKGERHVLHVFTTKKEDILAAQKELNSGKSFKEVSQKYSEDENTKQDANLSFIEKGYMPKAFDEVAFSLSEGSVSDIIKTEEGYHILKIVEIQEKGKPISYKRIKNFLARGMKEKTKVNNIAAHLKQLREEADIEIFLPKNTTSQ